MALAAAVSAPVPPPPIRPATNNRGPGYGLMMLAAASPAPVPPPPIRPATNNRGPGYGLMMIAAASPAPVPPPNPNPTGNNNPGPSSGPSRLSAANPVRAPPPPPQRRPGVNRYNFGKPIPIVTQPFWQNSYGSMFSYLVAEHPLDRKNRKSHSQSRNSSWIT